MKNNNFHKIIMENKALKKLSNNFDDIEMKKINYFNSSFGKDNDILEQTKAENIISNNPSNLKISLSIMDKANDLFKSKLDNNKYFEETKNIDYDIYQDIKEKTIPSKNFLKNANLYQNANIADKINNIMDRGLNDEKTKINFDYSNSPNNIYLINKKGIISNKKKDIKYNIKEKEGKTIFNYNEESQKKLGREERHIENIEQYNKEKNIIIKDNEKNSGLVNPINNINLSSTPNYTLVKNSTNMKYDEISNIDVNKDISNDIKEKTQDYKPPLKTYYNSYKKLIDNKEYNFNYRSDESFNNINKQSTQTIETNYKIDLKVNNLSENKSNINSNNNYNLNNDYLSKINNDNRLKFNNYLNSNDLDIKKNNYLYNNDNKYSSSLDSNDMTEKEREIKIQIENEEKKLKKLEEEKNQLIKEEKERRETIVNEINKRENISNNEQVKKNKKEESQIKEISSNKYNINSNINYNFCKDFLKEIQNRNEIINKNALNTINNNINKYAKININTTHKNKSLSVGNKQIEIKEYINNYNSSYKKNDYKSNNNSIYNRNNNLENVNRLTKNKKRFESEKKYNVNSYFQLKDRINNTEINNINTNLYFNINSYNDKNKNDQSLSSYIDETNKDNNALISKVNEPKNIKNYQVSFTPNGCYRNIKNDNNFINLRTDNFDNLLYNKNYYINNDKYNNMEEEIVKTLSENNNNSMTQTRFYRNRVLPELKYENDKINDLNEMKDYNFKNFENNNLRNNFIKQNSIKSFSRLNFDLDKDYINNSNKYNNFITNSQNNTLINKTYKTLTNNARNNSILYQKNKYSNKLNTYRCKCTLRKGRSSNDITKINENNKKESSIIASLSNNINSKNTEYYGISSNITKGNNYNNLIYDTFNKNNSSANYHNANQRNICEKCREIHFNKENNGIIGNGFRNCNTLRLCNTCKKLVGGRNFIN